MSSGFIPRGFEPHFRKSNLTDPWEPIYSKICEDRVLIGVVLDAPHCNSRGLVHGGLISALADNAMGLSCFKVLQGEKNGVSGLLTLTLSTDFMAAGQLGHWLEIDTDYVKAGQSVCFARAMVRSDGEPIAKANATFKVLRAR